MKWYIHALRNYANFDGRSSRTEYWMFGLFNMMFAFLFYSIDLIFDIGFGKLGFGPFYALYALLAFIPGLAVGVRRLHDVDKSGWYMLLAIVPLVNIYLIVLFCTASDEEENYYGEKPENSDIGEFINDDKTNSVIIITYLLWLFVNRLIWVIVTKNDAQFYQNTFYKYYGELSNVVWMFSPIFLAFTVKNYKWKIILIILSVFYLLYCFYNLVEMHLSRTHLSF